MHRSLKERIATRRADSQDIMAARSGYLDCSLHVLLTFDFGEIELLLRMCGLHAYKSTTEPN